MPSYCTVEIGHSAYDAEALRFEFPDKESYRKYEDASFALERAKTAYAKALGEPKKWPTGICSFWITNVRLTHDGNEYIKAGTVGDLDVCEVSADRQHVIKARFFPRDSNGFGLVICPKFERIR